MKKKDWTSNEVSFVTTNGFANNRKHKRAKHDYYATEPKAVELLLKIEDFSKKNIWECACGEGHLSKQMIKQGYKVLSTDLIDRGFGKQQDFLKTTTKFNGHIITNPPYKYATEFIVKALDLIPKGCKVAMFLPVRYTEGKERRLLFEAYPPKVIYISSSRLKCAINGNFNKMTGSATSYAWFVWEKGHQKQTIVKWFN